VKVSFWRQGPVYIVHADSQKMRFGKKTADYAVPYANRIEHDIIHPDRREAMLRPVTSFTNCDDKPLYLYR